MLDNSFSIKSQRLKYQVGRFYKNAWPINWSNFKNLELLKNSIQKAGYGIKMVLVVSLIGSLFSIGFLSLGAFDVLTVRVKSQGGDFYEAFVGNTLNRFNPVLSSSESESKINNLLYHPLYRVDYPDFLINPEEKPKITPILLADEPVWSANPNNESDSFHTLNFKLRDDIQWSNGKPITNQDVQYSFARLKEEGGNGDFKSVLENYNIEIVPGSQTEFKIVPSGSNISANPQLKYMVNFSPVSKDFYTNSTGSEMNNEELKNNVKSREVKVTSGFFTIPASIEDPETGNKVDNPRWSNSINGYNQVVLESNPRQNYGDGIFLNRYIFNVYEHTEDSGGDSMSLERAAKRERLDLYTRSLLSTSQRDSSEIQEILDLNQSIQPTNTFLSMFFNVESSATGFLINPYLRRYIACHFQDSELTTRFKGKLEVIPPEKRNLPLHFDQESKLDCPEDLNSIILDYRNTANQQVYTIDEDERGGVKRVRVFNNIPTLNLLSLEEFSEQADFIRDIMTKAGLPMNANYIPSGRLPDEIREGNYHIAFLPITPSSADPYSIYGLSSQNISRISSSRERTATDNIENGREFEEVLKRYSQSALQDIDAREKLIEFFQEQSMGVNLFRTKREFNYSDRVKNLNAGFSDFIAFSHQIYDKLPTWHVETRRRFRFFN